MGFLQGYARKLGVLEYLGTWDASTNTPNLTSSVGQKGGYYIVSVGGSTQLNGINDWQPQDWAIFNGTEWEKIDNSELVTSVSGRTGDVTLTASDIPDLTSAVQSALVAYNYVTATTATNTNATYTTVAELTTISLPIGLYSFKFIGRMQSGATQSGVGVRIFNGTSTISTCNAKWRIAQGANGTINQNFEYDQVATTTNIVSASVLAANSTFSVVGQGVFRVTSAGTAAIQIRSEANGTAASLLSDSVLIVEVV
jgi:hypothetical protein